MLTTEEGWKMFFGGCLITFTLFTIAHINIDHLFSKSRIAELTRICEPHGGVMNFSVDYSELTVYCNKDNVQVTVKAI